MPSENTLAGDLAALDAAEAACVAIVVPVKVAGKMCGKESTWAADRVNDKTFRTLDDGKRRMVYVSSIFDHLRARARASYAADGSLRKIRQPSSMFRKQPRPRTENELRGLAKANEARRREAQQRRVAAARRTATEIA